MHSSIVGAIDCTFMHRWVKFAAGDDLLQERGSFC